MIAAERPERGAVRLERAAEYSASDDRIQWKRSQNQWKRRSNTVEQPIESGGSGRRISGTDDRIRWKRSQNQWNRRPNTPEAVAECTGSGDRMQGFGYRMQRFGYRMQRFDGRIRSIGWRNADLPAQRGIVVALHPGAPWGRRPEQPLRPAEGKPQEKAGATGRSRSTAAGSSRWRFHPGRNRCSRTLSRRCRRVCSRRAAGCGRSC